jgi:hypothetical protein
VSLGLPQALSLHEGLVILIQILTGNIVLRKLPRNHFGGARIFGVLDTENNAGLERVTLFDQFFDTLRIRLARDNP